MNLRDTVTAAGAIAGTLLGGLSLWVSWRQTRVRARLSLSNVEVKRFKFVVGGTEVSEMISPGLEFINRSTFQVTLLELGYLLKGGVKYPLTRLDLPGQMIAERWMPDTLPHRLEPRTRIRVAWWDEDEKSLRGKRIVGAYARTACGAMVRLRGGRELRKLANRVEKGMEILMPVSHEGSTSPDAQR